MSNVNVHTKLTTATLSMTIPHKYITPAISKRVNNTQINTSPDVNGLAISTRVIENTAVKASVKFTRNS